MGLSITPVADYEGPVGTFRIKIVDVTFDDSYPAGGETVDRAALGLRTDIIGSQVIGGNAAAGRLLCFFDNINEKLMLIYPTGGGLASPPVLFDPVVAVIVPVGAVVVTSTSAQPGLTELFQPGHGKELLEATDVSTITYRIMFYGR